MTVAQPKRTPPPQRRPRPGPGRVVAGVRAAPEQVAHAAQGLRSIDRETVTGFRGLIRVVTTTAVHAVELVSRGSVDVARELVREVSSGEPIFEIVETRVESVRAVAWRALGLKDSLTVGGVPERFTTGRSSFAGIRAQGDRLLERSTEPEPEEAHDQHPAFARILEEMVPDEARILRFMALAGPQPAIDIRTKTPFGVGSERVAGGINMIADMAGCLYPDRNQEYLANLNRLGMVRFSIEQVDDPRRYSFIEAQPVAADAMAKVKNAVTVYRSIYLSLFGHHFCSVCFTLDEGYDAGGWIHDVR